jgi:hypothetical protein
MLKLQSILEHGCFGFGERRLGRVIAEHGWECAEAVLLSRWRALLLEEWDGLQMEMGKEKVVDVFPLLDGI